MYNVHLLQVFSSIAVHYNFISDINLQERSRVQHEGFF